jgi:hypothetical protein
LRTSAGKRQSSKCAVRRPAATSAPPAFCFLGPCVCVWYCVRGCVPHLRGCCCVSRAACGCVMCCAVCGWVGVGVGRKGPRGGASAASYSQQPSVHLPLCTICALHIGQVLALPSQVSKQALWK